MLQDPERILLTIDVDYIEIFVGRGDMQVFQSVQGSTAPLLVQLKDRKGNVLVVTAATLTMLYAVDGASKISAKAMTLDDGANGKISYSFNASTESNEPGTFKAQINATVGGQVYKIPERVWVKFKRAYD